MALKIRKIPMPVSQYPIKCPYGMTPTRIVIHNTANDAPAENEIKYMQSNSAQTSFHYAVDDKEAVQGVELWRNAWHAGDGANGKGNREGIAIEICYSKSGGERFAKAEENGAELAAKLLLDFGWGLDKITKHQDYSPWKRCPGRTLDLGWDRFVKMVEKKYKAMAGLGLEDEDEVVNLNGFKIERAHDFSILYWDKSKRKGTASSYINGGFFGYYKENGVNFTLPVGNLVCDIMPGSIKEVAMKYLSKCIRGSKLCYGTADNASNQFKGKLVSTLVLPQTGSPYVKEFIAPPASCRYAISGVPVIRGGEDVSYKNFVVPQGWDTSCFYATSRNFIGIKGTTLWIVSGATKTSNYVATSEVYEKLKDFHFDELVCTDGGGSFYHKYKGKANLVWNDRDVNNLIAF
jgi:hypothetical protein